MKAYTMQGCYNYEDESVMAVYATRELAVSAMEARRQKFFEERQEEALVIDFETDFAGRWVAECHDDVEYDYIKVTEVDFVS